VGDDSFALVKTIEDAAKLQWKWRSLWGGGKFRLSIFRALAGEMYALYV
jgi:hypothetical protein